MKRKGKRLLSIFCSFMMLASANFSVAHASDNEYLVEGFGTGRGTEAAGYDGWVYANEYKSPNVDDNVFKIVSDSSNDVLSIAKTNEDTAVTNKNRKWIAKELNIPASAANVVMSFKVKNVKGSGRFDIGFRGADKTTWLSDGHIRLFLGSQRVELVKSTGSAYDYYNKMNTENEWHDVILTLDAASDYLAVKVDGNNSGSFKLSTDSILKNGNIPTAIGFGFARSTAGAEAYIDDLKITSDVINLSVDTFDLAQSGSLLKNNGWSDANAYTDGGLNNIYTVETDSADSTNKVAQFVKGPSSGNSRLWSAKSFNMDSSTQKVAVEFDIRSLGVDCSFDLGFCVNGSYTSNGNIRLNINSNPGFTWFPGLSGSYSTSMAAQYKTAAGAWNKVKLIYSPFEGESGMLYVYINGTSRGSDRLTKTGFPAKVMPTGFAMGWLRSQAVGAKVEIDNVKIYDPDNCEKQTNVEETFTRKPIVNELMGYNGWSLVNAYTYPKVDDNVFSIVEESPNSANLVGNFEKTDSTVTDKQRKWAGKTFTLPIDTDAVNISFKIRRMSQEISRFDVGFLNESESWGSGDGFFGLFIGANQDNNIRLINDTYLGTDAFNEEIGEWNLISIDFDKVSDTFCLKVNGETVTKRSTDIGTRGHMSGSLPIGIGFGFGRSASAAKVQIDDVCIMSAEAAKYSSLIKSVDIMDNKVSQVTINNGVAVPNAILFAGVYENESLVDVTSASLSQTESDKGNDITISLPKALSVNSNSTVKAFLWNASTLVPYAVNTNKVKADSINFDKAVFSGTGDTTKNITVHVIGDSTAMAYGSNDYPRTGWAQKLDQYFTSNVTVNDDAISGESSVTFYEIPAHWQTTISEVNAGDYVLIQFGHNDEKKTGTSLVDTTKNLYADYKTTYKEYLKKYIDETRAKGATPILVTSINRRNFGIDGLLDASNTNLLKYVNAMKEVAQAENVTLIDLNEKTKALYEYYGCNGSSALFMNLNPGEFANYPQGSTDNTHLREEGATEIAKLFAIGLNESGIELASYLKK